ncbi:type I restriction endonuclease subunit R [Daejeonella sp.]|jgi:type I restriction enzyme R subunit|uniref:type I restriction endonuclease subunit R n=1 Tax=Daejeonella sp. TaxID=2805397 RepID=UPI0037846BE9
MAFNENSRVKIPTILHLVRLGFDYLSLKGQKWDETTNIFTDVFNKSIKRLNPGFTDGDVKRLYDEVSLSLENEDLGKVFYEKLTSTSGKRIIDFENFDNNTFNVVTELTYRKDDDEFRPDIILLINGMPLAFIEVKKPNNQDGILAEHKRIQTRFENKKFKKFVNLTQLMVFSNNMEYDTSSPLPIEGAFYATASYQKPGFNFFREEDEFDLAKILSDVPDDMETAILIDTNLVGIKHSSEFITNKDPKTPTNKICTSLFQRERFSFLLQYGLAYVKEKNGLQKHIMRYPQLFATKAIEKKLEEGIKKGIIWHTQGSGKTALAYYSVKYLTDYFHSKGIVPKFYFIVDRIDLLIQSGREFKSRGLVVHNINSREEFARDIKSTSVIHNNSGKAEITVVNIQKFEDDTDVIKNNDYNLNIQRVYFLDEVHRSYNPKGSFLANLHESDANAIKIGLTGTPLLGTDFNSKSLFGGYIHKYYYNASIADGYTLRLIREEIETKYKLSLQQALADIKLLKGDADKKTVYAHPKFVEPMLDYIVHDFENARIAMNDQTIGGMVVCDSSEQAKMMFEIFESNYAISQEESHLMAAEPAKSYGEQKKIGSKVKSAALILHDIGTKDERKEKVENFKEGKIDFLFVYNMLLTGFDAPRLKKLYIGRVIKAHNLLQTLTRVNRTYKEFRYGYVVDFADIQKEFDKTNRAYFDELQAELGDEMQHYSDIFKSVAEITAEIHQIEDVLFKYDTKNAEVFSQQITQISDRKQMLEIVKALNSSRELYNIIRLSGNYEMLDKLDFHKLTQLAREANNRLTLINTKEALENNVDTSNLLNIALEDVIFAFVKVKEEEMILADQLKNILQKTRESLGGNFDPKDPIFISLKEELERLFKKKNLNEVTKDEMEQNIKELENIYSASKELERKNQLLKAKYANDAKYVRLHKRLMEKDPLTDSESKLFEALQSLKQEVDAQIVQNSKMMENESYVERMMVKLVIEQLKNKYQLPLDAEQAKVINALMVKEYMNEFYGRVA